MLNAATRQGIASASVTVSPSSLQGMTKPKGVGGRKSKGPRVFRGARLPEYVDEALVRVAAQQGLTANDFIVNAIAAHCGLERVFPPRPQLFEPQELALKQAS